MVVGREVKLAGLGRVAWVVEIAYVACAEALTRIAGVDEQSDR